MSVSIVEVTAISPEYVRGLCPNEMMAIEKHPQFPGWGRMPDFLDCDEDEAFFEYDDDVREDPSWPQLHDEFAKLWKALQDAFAVATHGGGLGWQYIDLDRLDKYDCEPSNDDGFVFSPFNTEETVLTKAGEFLGSNLTQMTVIQHEV